MKEHVSLIRQLGRSFQIHLFDSKAASIAATLRNEPGDKKLAWKEARDAAKVTAQEIKADILIVATAMAAGGRAIVTHDAGVHALADHPHVMRMGFEIRELPSVQSELFETEDE